MRNYLKNKQGSKQVKKKQICGAFHPKQTKKLNETPKLVVARYVRDR